MFASMIDGMDEMYDDIPNMEEEEVLAADAVDMEYIAKIGKKSQRIEESLNPNNRRRQFGGIKSDTQPVPPNLDFSASASQAISEWVVKNPKVLKAALSEAISAIQEPYVESLIEQEVKRRVDERIQAKIDENNKLIVGMIKKYMGGGKKI